MKTVLGHSHKTFGQMTAYELIEWLDEHYPHQCANIGDSMDHIQRTAGARALVDSLLSKLKNEDS